MDEVHASKMDRLEAVLNLGFLFLVLMACMAWLAWLDSPKGQAWRANWRRKLTRKRRQIACRLGFARPVLDDETCAVLHEELLKHQELHPGDLPREES